MIDDKTIKALNITVRYKIRGRSTSPAQKAHPFLVVIGPSVDKQQVRISQFNFVGTYPINSQLLKP
jgi:hypothetical protein